MIFEILQVTLAFWAGVVIFAVCCLLSMVVGFHLPELIDLIDEVLR